ncbi:MAG: ECF transporter S component [Oscillospiraceae bacterium]|nr:ECF transporter S component [Oscillospiraceae bacterium]
MSEKSYRIAFMGMGAAIVFVCGYFLKISVLNGYYNLEDCAVLILAFTMNMPVAVASAVGAGLCDLLSGSAIYAIPSSVIYAVIGVVTSIILSHKGRNGKSFCAYALAAIACEGIVFAGYVSTFCVLYGVSDFIGVSLFYLMQIALNLIVSLALYPVAVRIRKFTQNHIYRNI